MNQTNIDIFNDTIGFIKENDVLNTSVSESIKRTSFHPDNDYPSFDIKKDRDGVLIISKRRSFEAAMNLYKQYPNKRIGVLNFASATNPGGGVTHGSSAQEEALCRCSTLYPVIQTKELYNKYYGPNRRARNNLHDDAVIYTPDIVICKTDTKYPVRLSEKEFVKVDVLSCAAPNLREQPSNLYNLDNSESVNISDEELYKIHLRRAKHILYIAKYHHIDVLVLGAFGCGAFRNNPEVVAKAYKDVLKEYGKCFDAIEFAIYCSPYDMSNYEIFNNILNS